MNLLLTFCYTAFYTDNYRVLMVKIPPARQPSIQHFQSQPFGGTCPELLLSNRILF